MSLEPSFTLLVVDDEPDVVDALRRVLRDPRYEIVGTTSPNEALELLTTRHVDLVISDLDMPELHGLELLRRVRRDHPDVVRVVLTGRATLESALVAINQGEVHRYLTKPWEQAALRRTIGELVDRLAELRFSADAAIRVVLREDIHVELERAYPGVTEVALADGAVSLDASRLDALWTLRDALGDSPADAWLLDTPDARASRPLEQLEKLSGVVLDQRFRLDEAIGSGGFGVVYKALQLSLERFVAVKVLRTQGSDRDQLKRFRVEALSTCRVVHPNAVTILEAGVTERGLAYLVMELLNGETVAQLLRRGATLTFDAAALMAAEVCDALAVAHDSGIFHRDIKPANVFLHQGASGPITKLLDFGVAKLASHRASLQGVTEDGVVVGTPAYIAPERLSRRPVDGRADVYAVGVLLYEALSGQRPFPGTSATEVARQQLSVQPRALAALDPSVPAALDAIIVELLAKDPSDRPTASQAAAKLRAVAPGLPAEHMRRATAAASIATRTS